MLTFDEPHGVKRPAVGVGSQAVDRHDPRMFQVSRDLGFGNEPLAADRIARVTGLNFLESDAAMKLGILGQVNLPQPASSVRPQDLIARCGFVPQDA